MTGSTSTPSTPAIIPIAAPTQFPTKLISTNFTVWRKQVFAALIGLNLDKFLTSNAPSKLINNDPTKPNPEFDHWFRQDQMILSALLGSCSEAIQPLIASADTSRQAWETLNKSFASASRSRIVSLKSKLAKNPKGNRTISEFLQDMKSIADELALAQSPIQDEDLTVHILAQLGEEYSHMTAALKARDTPLTFPELFDKLVDFERSLGDSASTPAIVSVNSTQRQNQRSYSRSPADSRVTNRSYLNGTKGSRFAGNQSYTNQNNRGTRNSAFCYYCNIPGHDTKDCRKLARFLRENNLSLSQAPTVNTTSAGSGHFNPPWMFDTGASEHVAPNQASFHTLSEYGGPDEIVLGNGSSHGGVTNAGSERK